jgi:hypothetical protein
MFESTQRNPIHLPLHIFNLLRPSSRPLNNPSVFALAILLHWRSNRRLALFAIAILWTRESFDNQREASSDL